MEIRNETVLRPVRPVLLEADSNDCKRTATILRREGHIERDSLYPSGGVEPVHLSAEVPIQFADFSAHIRVHALRVGVFPCCDD